jgi:chaperonin GroES
MKLKATGDHVVAKKIEVESKTQGGLILPNSASPESFERGEVVSVGPEVEDIKTGDVIAYSQHAGQDMLSTNKDVFKVLKYGEVYCIIE